jgi:thiamine-phosphate pyrophosphorylase
MKIIVISPEGTDPREQVVVKRLFDAGLDRYHLRKPSWTETELEAWVLRIDFPLRQRLVLHRQPALAQRLGLGGIHLPDNQSPGDPWPTGGRRIYRSRAVHDLPMLQRSLGGFDALLLSPIFSSISKPGYSPGEALSQEKIATALRQRSPVERATTIYALGGVTADNAVRCRELGFDGVALLGCVWKTDDPFGAFDAVRRQLA